MKELINRLIEKPDPDIQVVTDLFANFRLGPNRYVKRDYNPPMAKGGGGGGGCHPLTGFSSFSREWEELFWQTKFLAVVGSSLGHVSMKKFFRSDLPSWP